MRGIVIALATAAATIAACSSFSDTEPPSTPGDDAEAPDAASIDASGDTLPSDGEGGVDATPAPAFCKTDGGALCEDFDDPGSAALPKSVASDGGALSEVADPRVSPPHSLRVTFAPPPPDDDCRIAARYNDSLALPIPDGFRIEYKIRASTIPGRLTHGASVQLEDTNENGAGCSVYMNTTSSESVLAIEKNGAGSQAISLMRKVVAGQWSHVIIEVRGGPGGRTASVTIDGISAANDVPILLDCQSFDRIYQVSVGILCATKALTGDADVAFDDVRLAAR